MSRPQDKRLPYMPGIDALRAIAVLAVFFYHGGVGWMPGGFLGVDVFFVISGYLITSLLLSEYRRGGHVDLWKFWLRRARRLLPAVGVLIAVTMVVAAFLVPDQVPQLRGDALSSLGYFANWHFIFDHQSYFQQFQRPSLFRHLWSLSVEEQFYLFWPLAFAAGMSLFGRRRLLLGVLAGALASVALAWILFDPGGDTSRVYYGTDTHAVGLLAGVALALVWNPSGLRRGTPGRWAGPLLDAVGVFAIAFVVLSFLRVHDYDLALYHGGYLWLALFTALLLAVLAHPSARLGGLIAQPPLVWLGLRSYSFYLWHWPVLVLTRPGVDVSMPRGILIPLQLLAVLALADLSYRFVERPFATGGRLPKLPRGWGRLTRPVLAAAVLGVIVLAGWSGLVGNGGGHLEPGAASASTKEFATVRVRYHQPARQSDRDSPPHSSARPHSEASPSRGKPPRIIAIGDSVMIGARDQLAKRLGSRFSMNARIGRQAEDFIKLVHQLRAKGHQPDALIIQMGNNGPLYSDDMAAIRHYTRGLGHLFFVSDEAPVSWEGQSNSALLEAAKEWPQTSLINWHAIAGRSGYTWDGIHLTPTGARAYAKLVAHDVLGQIGTAPARQRAKPAAPAAPQAKRASATSPKAKPASAASPRAKRASAASPKAKPASAAPKRAKPRRHAKRRAAPPARSVAGHRRRASPPSRARRDRRREHRRSSHA
jgi:peptidoglycan/LPS O-acetylase OafA/YrhL